MTPEPTNPSDDAPLGEGFPDRGIGQTPPPSDSARSVATERPIASRPRSVPRNALWNIFATLCSLVSLFFLAPFLIARIGTEQYGFYLLMASVSGMMGTMELGLGEATLRYVAYYYGREDVAGINRVLGATSFVYLVMATLTAGAVLAAAPRIVTWFALGTLTPATAAYLLRITALAFWVRFLAGPYLAVPAGLLRYDILSQVLVIETVLRVGGAVAVVLWGGGLAGLIQLNIVLGLFLLLAGPCVARRLVPGIRLLASPSRRGLREVFGYGVFAFLSRMVGSIWQHADKLLLGVFLGTEAVVYFAVPQQIALRVLGLCGTAGGVLMPKFSSVRRRSELRRLWLLATRTLLYFSLAAFVPMTVLIREFLAMWVPPEIGDFAVQGGTVAMIIAASCIIRGAFPPYETLFRGLGKPQYYLAVITLSSLTILLADLILIPTYGLTGAGVAYCISPVWGLAAIAFCWKRLLKMPRWEPLLAAIGGPVLIASVLLGVFFVVKPRLGWQPSWLGLAVQGAAMGLVVLLALAGYEKLFAQGAGVFAYLRRKLAAAVLPSTCR